LIWSWLVFQFWRRRRLLVFGGAVRYGLGITLLVGGGVELIQAAMPGRSASGFDLLADVTGTLLALFFLIPERLSWPPLQRRIGQILTLSLLLVAVIPVARAAVVDVLAWKEFPNLADFSSPFVLDRWEGSAQRDISPPVVAGSDECMRVQFGCELYSGISLGRMPRNWSAYSTLSLDFYLPESAPLDLTCRIHDIEHTAGEQKYSDRFNLTLHLVPGLNRIDISLAEVRQAPHDRDLNLKNIAGLGLFTTDLVLPRTLFVQNIQLR